MPSIATERIQAPSAGVNTDASPDYVGATEAAGLVNMLPGQPGKAVVRGQIVSNITGVSATGAAPTAFWAFDDFALIKGDAGSGVKTWRCNVTALSKTDETATLVESPLDYRHARYGDYIYGAITDANQPQLGRWDGGATAIVPMDTAPLLWTDLQTYAQRLFILGGTAPGTTTPIVNSGRVLWWTDPGSTLVSKAATGVAATDIITSAAHGYADGGQVVFSSLTGGAGLTTNTVYYVITSTTNTFQVALTAGGAAVNFTTDISAGTVWKGFWQDDVSGLTNQLNYDADDTPIGLAGCGRFMAIVGSRSINILTGTGSSSFAIRNLTKNWGCLDIRTIVEVDDGFYFLSDRGFAYCDGSTVVSVSEGRVSAALAANRGQVHMAAVWNDGYIALQSLGVTWLYHVASHAWTQIVMGSSTTSGVFRTNTYPILWQNGGLRRAELATRRGIIGIDNDGSTSAPIPITWTSRFARLASPGQVATVQRLLFEYAFVNSDANGFRVRVLDTQGTELANQIVPTITTSRRQRFQVDVFAETDSVQLVVTSASTSANNIDAEIYDAYIEFIPAQVRATV